MIGVYFSSGLAVSPSPFVRFRNGLVCCARVIRFKVFEACRANKDSIFSYYLSKVLLNYLYTRDLG
jgi:hypothetical protein